MLLKKLMSQSFTSSGFVYVSWRILGKTSILFMCNINGALKRCSTYLYSELQHIILTTDPPFLRQVSTCFLRVVHGRSVSNILLFRFKTVYWMVTFVHEIVHHICLITRFVVFTWGFNFSCSLDENIHVSDTKISTLYKNQSSICTFLYYLVVTLCDVR